jgi:hypothetical protein
MKDRFGHGSSGGVIGVMVSEVGAEDVGERRMMAKLMGTMC